MGTPEFAVPALAELVRRGHEIVAVYTRAPRPAGRGMQLHPSPVEQEARRLGLAVVSPAALRTSQIEDTFRAHRADAAVVVAYGLILPRPILDAPPLGCFNLHASGLPRWRGAAPINRAIMAGDNETAVAVMKLEPGLDTGPVALMECVMVGADMTAGALHDQLARLGAGLIGEAIDALERGALMLTPQASNGVTYAPKIDKAEIPHRVGKAVAERARSHSRLVAPSGGMVCDAGPGDGPDQGATFDAGRGRGRTRDRPRREADDRLREWGGAYPRTATRWAPADDGGPVPARHPDPGRLAIGLMSRQPAGVKENVFNRISKSKQWLSKPSQMICRRCKAPVHES